LLREGYDVSAWDNTEGRLAQADDPHLTVKHVDVRNAAAVRMAVRDTMKRDAVLVGLVACAAVYRAAPFLALTEEAWDEAFEVNLTGSLLVCQAVLPEMRSQRRGSIVLFSSSLARTGAVNGAHYAATKGGILGLMRSLALEAAKDGIRVNAVSPGLTDTPQPRGHSSEEEIRARAGAIPLGRIGTPDDMAEAVLFLLGDDSSFVTGQDIRPNGGSLLF
jgi:NAD(P)-dependent dehydrogenase (short-subunit alcohol dehydrogenase family)